MKQNQEIHYRRNDKEKWKQFHSLQKKTQPYLLDIARWHHRIQSELLEIEDEITLEKDHFQSEWKKYEETIQSKILQQPLPKPWIPQFDSSTRQRYFLNLKTGECQMGHPLNELAKTKIEKQKTEAYAILNKRIETLCDYRKVVVSTEISYQKECEEKMQTLRLEEIKKDNHTTRLSHYPNPDLLLL